MDDQSQTDPRPENEADYINDLSEAFDKLCEERFRAGQEEYGKFTFLGNDVIRMMMEELADTANYCRMQFVKLMVLQEHIESMIEGTGEVQIGAQAFKGVGEVGWKR